MNFSFTLLKQPYRTTPLILPGAKVKKDVVPNECYLRHHPNPLMRGRAPHVDENFLRQRVITFDIFHLNSIILRICMFFIGWRHIS